MARKTTNSTTRDDRGKRIMSTSLYFSIKEFCEEENLDKETLKNVAVDLGRMTNKEIAEKHGIHDNTVSNYKGKLADLGRENYIAIMNLIYQEELNRALLE